MHYAYRIHYFILQADFMPHYHNNSVCSRPLGEMDVVSNAIEKGSNTFRAIGRVLAHELQSFLETQLAMVVVLSRRVLNGILVKYSGFITLEPLDPDLKLKGGDVLLYLKNCCLNTSTKSCSSWLITWHNVTMMTNFDST